MTGGRLSNRQSKTPRTGLEPATYNLVKELLYPIELPGQSDINTVPSAREFGKGALTAKAKLKFSIEAELWRIRESDMSI